MDNPTVHSEVLHTLIALCIVSGASVIGSISFALGRRLEALLPSYAEQIFGVFRRLHSRSQYPGNGIGLAICARVIAYYGGRIWAESRPGEGAAFHFTLPSAEGPG